MYTSNKKLMDQKIYDTWIPKIKERYKEKGFNVDDISEAKLKKIAKMAHVRKIYESYTPSSLTNTPGRGAFSFGNNPENAADGAKGSGEVFSNLFGVFLDAAAITFGMDLLPLLTMNKSNLTVYIVEPIYAGGKIDSTTSNPEVFMAKITATGTGPTLTIGSTYYIKDANGTANGDAYITVKYVGKERVKGYAVFRVTTLESTYSITSAIAAGHAKIFTDGSNYWTLDADTVDYVSGYTNFVSGYSGSGLTDTASWGLNRSNGTTAGSQPMARATGESTYYRSMGVRQWSRNYEAQTYHVDISYTTEQIQDARMDHDSNLLEIGDQIMQDQLAQSMNDHILTYIFANGWQHHYEMNQINSFNMNAYLSTGTGSSQSFYGLGTGEHELTSRTISGASGVLHSSGAIYENLSTLQRRVITRIFYGSAVVKNRSRKGNGDTSVFNGTLATAIKDVRGYQASTFKNDFDDNGLSYMGTFNNISCYEDGLMELTDNRFAIFRKGKDKDPGIKIATYILAEKIGTVAEGIMSVKEALKSRYTLARVGTAPQLNYLTAVVETSSSYSIV